MKGTKKGGSLRSRYGNSKKYWKSKRSRLARTRAALNAIRKISRESNNNTNPISPRRGLPSRLREYLKRRSKREVNLGDAVRIMGPKERGEPCLHTNDCEDGKHLHCVRRQRYAMYYDKPKCYNHKCCWKKSLLRKRVMEPLGKRFQRKSKKNVNSPEEPLLSSPRRRTPPVPAPRRRSPPPVAPRPQRRSPRRTPPPPVPAPRRRAHLG